MGKARRRKTHGVAARAAADSRTAISTEESQPPSTSANNAVAGAHMDMKSGVLDGLTSLNALTRESSCAAIASLFEKIDSPEAGSDSWSAAQRLIAGGLVKKLLPRMVDRAPDVKVQATGAMRNISAVRDPRVCEILVHDDCLTPVLTLLGRMSTTAPSPSSGGVVAAAADTVVLTPQGAATPKDASGIQKPDSSKHALMNSEKEVVIMAQLVATLCNLLAAVDVAVGRFTRQGGLQVVMRLLLPEGGRGSSEIFSGVLQVLHVATDSNFDFAGQLAALPGAIDQLSALVRGADVPHVKVSMSMRVQAAGVLVNVAGLSGNVAQSAKAQSELSGLVLPLLLEQMKYDPTVLQQACVALAAANTKLTAADDTEKMDVDGEGAIASSTDGVNGEKEESGGEENMEDEATVGAQVAAGVAATVPMQVTTGEAGGNSKLQLKTGQDGGGEKSGKGEGAKGPLDEEGKHAVEDKIDEDGEVAAADQPDKDARIRWEWKLRVAEPLKLTAEVMANLCALAAGEDEEEEEEWGSDDEDAMEQAASGGEVRQQKDALMGGGGSAPNHLLLGAMAEGEALQRTIATLKALLSPTRKDQQPSTTNDGKDGGKAPSPPPTGDEVIKDHLPLPSGVAGDLADLRSIVALCAANLVQNLPLNALGDNPHALWADLCGMCESAMQRAPSCVETLTGVMWGLVRRAGPAIATGPTEAPSGSVTNDSLPVLLRLCDSKTTRAFEARVNAVGMLGSFGGSAITAASEITKRNRSLSGVVGRDGGEADDSGLKLGRALVLAMEDPHVLVQAEALNAVMDMYGDDDMDAAYLASGAPETLATGVAAFQRKVKQEGKALGRDALCHLKETALNASRFVKYKQAVAVGREGGKGGGR